MDQEPTQQGSGSRPAAVGAASGLPAPAMRPACRPSPAMTGHLRLPAYLAVVLAVSMLTGSYLYLKRGVPLVDSMAIALYCSFVGFLMFVKSDGSPHAEALYKLAGGAAWALRVGLSIELGFIRPACARLKSFMGHGVALPFVLVSEFVIQALTRHIPLKLRVLMCATHALGFSTWSHRCSSTKQQQQGGLLAWAQLTLLTETSLLSVLLFEYLSKRWPRRTSASSTSSALHHNLPAAAAHSKVAHQTATNASASSGSGSSRRLSKPGAVDQLRVPGSQDADEVQASPVSPPRRRPSHLSSPLPTSRGPAAQRLEERLAAAPYPGSSYKVCIKLQTDLPITALPVGLSGQLQQALTGLNGGAYITQMTARTGCIMLSLDLHSASSLDHQGMSHNHAYAMALTLLDQLHAALSSIPHDKCSSAGPVVKQATLQVDSVLLTASWRQDSGSWEVKVAAPGKGPAAAAAGGTPSLGAALPIKLARAAGPECSLLAPAGTLELSLEVQLWGMSSAKAVQGWSPPPAGQHARESPGEDTSMKLLASCKGAYLATRVRGLAPTRAHAQIVIAEVVVEVPAGLLTTHHPGGPPSAVLLLNLELWRGEVFISETPLLATPPPTADAQLHLSSWWWGAPAAQVRAALAEVQRCTQALAAEVEGTVGAVPNYLLFLHDLRLWLQQVQGMAQGTPFCRTTEASLKGAPAGRSLEQQLLPASSLQQLASDLMQYTQAAGLDAVQHMVRQQLRGVVQQQAGAWCPPWLPMRTSLTGFECSMCEQLYKTQVSTFQALSTVVLAPIGLLVVVQFVWQGQWKYACLVSCWGLCHCANLMVLLRARSTRRAAGGGQPFSVWAYIWKMAYQASWLLGIIPRQLTLGSHGKIAPWALLYTVFSLTEQMQAGASLPASWLFFIALFLDTPSIAAKAAQEIKPAVPAAVLTPFVVVLPRLLLDHYLRGRFGTCQHCPQHCPTGVHSENPQASYAAACSGSSSGGEGSGSSLQASQQVGAAAGASRAQASHRIFHAKQA